MGVMDSMVSVAELDDIRRPEIPARAPAGKIIIASFAASQINAKVMLKASKADRTGSVLNIFKHSWHFSVRALVMGLRDWRRNGLIEASRNRDLIETEQFFRNPLTPSSTVYDQPVEALELEG
jgi:hypothetical protein